MNDMNIVQNNYVLINKILDKDLLNDLYNNIKEEEYNSIDYYIGTILMNNDKAGKGSIIDIDEKVKENINIEIRKYINFVKDTDDISFLKYKELQNNNIVYEYGKENISDYPKRRELVNEFNNNVNNEINEMIRDVKKSDKYSDMEKSKIYQALLNLQYITTVEFEETLTEPIAIDLEDNKIAYNIDKTEIRKWTDTNFNFTHKYLNEVKNHNYDINYVLTCLFYTEPLAPERDEFKMFFDKPSLKYIEAANNISLLNDTIDKQCTINEENTNPYDYFGISKADYEDNKEKDNDDIEMDFT